MKKFKKFLLWICAILAGFTIYNIMCVIPWGLMAGYVYLGVPDQSEPVVEYAEFPFCLVYELSGKEYVVEDSIVCEYAGQDFNEGTGEKYRKWNSYLKSGQTRITLLNTEDGIEIFFLDLLTFPSGAYMGDSDKTSINEIFPNAYYTANFENKTVGRYIIKADEMWEKYKLRLISWKIADPIENEFK